MPLGVTLFLQPPKYLTILVPKEEVEKVKRLSLVFIGLLGLTAFMTTSCNQLGNLRGQAVQAALGTYNYGGAKPGIAFLIVGDVPMTGPDGVEVKVTGPSGWNGGKPLIVHLKHSVSGPDWWWWIWTIDIIDGDYTLESDLPGGIHLKKTARLTADDLLARPAPKLQATKIKATISWDAVPNAVVYSVGLRHITDSGSELVRWWRTKDTSITFNHLNLTPGETYYAWVLAFNAPLTRVSFTPPSVFKVSYGKTSDFTVTSAGVLKVLPSSSGQAPLEFDSQRLR